MNIFHGKNSSSFKREEIYRNDSPSAYSSNQSNVVAFSIDLEKEYDFYEIEAKYSNTISKYGRVLIDKNYFSGDGSGNRAGVTVGYLTSGRNLTVYRSCWISNGKLNFSSSYSNENCLITGVWGVNGKIIGGVIDLLIKFFDHFFQKKGVIVNG